MTAPSQLCRREVTRGYWVENYEPIAWAEEVIEPAQAVEYPGLAFLCAVASQCWIAGRIDEAIRYSHAGQTAMRSGGNQIPYGLASWFFGGAYVAAGRLQQWIDLCRIELAAGRDTHAFTTESLVMALTLSGSTDEVRAAVNGVIDAAEATCNPCALSFALLAYGFAYRDADPLRALEALRRGLVIAQDSGSRANESYLAVSLARLEAEHGDPRAALEYSTLAIRRYHDSGNTTQVRAALAVLAAFFDRLGSYQPAAGIAGFAFSPPYRGVDP